MYEMGLTQTKLSELLNVSPSRISEYLSGKCEPTLKVAREISRKLNIDANIVLGYKCKFLSWYILGVIPFLGFTPFMSFYDNRFIVVYHLSTWVRDKKLVYKIGNHMINLYFYGVLNQQIGTVFLITYPELR